MADPKNDETAFTNWPKVSTLTVFCPETTCATIGLSETCRIVLPDLQKREGNISMATAVIPIESRTVFLRPSRLMAIPDGIEQSANHRKTIIGKRLATVSDNWESCLK